MKLPSKVMAVAVAVSLVTMGCSTVNPYTGEKQTSKLAIGATIGAVAGGLIGAVTAKSPEERAKRAMIGAGIGGVAGGGVGVYMDQQEAELRQEMQATGVSVSRDGDDINLNMPGDITFAVAKSSLNPSFKNTLNGVVKVLNKYDNTLINIDGHTDSDGSNEFNISLSQQRANTVRNYLVSQGVAPERIEAIGRGESMPKASNNTAAGKSANRRVELRLIAIER